MKKLIYLFVAMFVASACGKDKTAKNNEKEKEEEKINFPASTVGNNKIRVLETTAGASTPQAEYDLSYLLVYSTTNHGKAQTVILPTSTNTKSFF